VRSGAATNPAKGLVGNSYAMRRFTLLEDRGKVRGRKARMAVL